LKSLYANILAWIHSKNKTKSGIPFCHYFYSLQLLTILVQKSASLLYWVPVFHELLGVKFFKTLPRIVQHRFQNTAKNVAIPFIISGLSGDRGIPDFADFCCDSVVSHSLSCHKGCKRRPLSNNQTGRGKRKQRKSSLLCMSVYKMGDVWKELPS
jgi:hypothetical protein